jgi:L-aspartate oxidase
VLAARLTTEAALMRTESRGGHYRSDFPERKEEWRRRIVFRAAA